MSVNLWYLQQLPRDAGQCRIAFQVPNRGILPFAPVSSFSKPPLRGVREPIPAGFRGFRRAVQRSRIRHPAGNAGRRSQGVGAGRLPTWSGWSSPLCWSLACPRWCRCGGWGRWGPVPYSPCSRRPSRFPFAVMGVPHHDTGGLCPIHGRARSNAADAASTLSSSYLRPII